MQHEKPDLVVSDITDRPIRKLILNVSEVQAGRLTLLEALDLADATGLDPDDFVSVMQRGSLKDKARLMYAFAWVVARRVEPGLTYEEVCTYQLEINGRHDPKADQKSRKRAEAVVAVASLAGVTPDEAEQMTIAEVAAVTELTKKRRASAARRRRAG